MKGAKCTCLLLIESYDCLMKWWADNVRDIYEDATISLLIQNILVSKILCKCTARLWARNIQVFWKKKLSVDKRGSIISLFFLFSIASLYSWVLTIAKKTKILFIRKHQCQNVTIASIHVKDAPVNTYKLFVFFHEDTS